MKRLNKNGFTFIEVLVTVGLLGIIMLVAVPAIISVRNKINERLYNTKKDLILSAAELYAQDEKISVDTTITVQTLLEGKYIDYDETSGKQHCPVSYTKGCVLNPINNNILNEIEVTVTKQGKTYKASSSWE